MNPNSTSVWLTAKSVARFQMGACPVVAPIGMTEDGVEVLVCQDEAGVLLTRARP